MDPCPLYECRRPNGPPNTRTIPDFGLLTGGQHETGDSRDKNNVCNPTVTAADAGQRPARLNLTVQPKMETPYQERVVAFIDIIGFSDLVSRLEEDPALHRRLFSALRAIKFYKEIAGDAQFAQKNLEASIFSDSIAISAAPEHVFDVVWACLGLQSRLLVMGVLTRGGVSSGFTVHQNDILYGSGMIRAYKLESGAAVYPRIIIDSDLVSRFTSGQKAMFLNEGQDGLWFIDPFAQGLLPPNSESLLEDGWDPNEVALEQLGKDIKRELQLATDDSRRMKWQWLERQRIRAVAFLKQNGRPRAFHLLHQAEQSSAANAVSPHR